jgi:enoyl-CoA hydratase/carnithine racemase
VDDSVLTAPAPGLLIGREGAIGWLVLDNPAKHNALTPEMMAGMPKAVAALLDDADVRVIVMRGAGSKAFAAGGDLRRSTEWNGTETQRDAAARFTQCVRDADKPVIAMIHGWCIGAGLLLALNADLRIAADDAQLGVLAARVGVGLPFSEVKMLTQIAGAGNAAEVVMTAARYGAGDALRLRLVNRVVAKADLEGETVKLASDIAENAPLTLRAFKHAQRLLADEQDEAARSVMQGHVDACYTSADLKEGVAAFAEKRKPRFAGR